MEVDMLEYNYPDLKEFITGGVSWSKVFQTLYYAHLLRYSDCDLLQGFTGSKLATKPKLSKLVKLGYLKVENNIFTSTQKTFELLKRVGYNANLPSFRNRAGKGTECNGWKDCVQD